MSDFFEDLWDGILEGLGSIIAFIVGIGAILVPFVIIIGIFGLCTNSNDSGNKDNIDDSNNTEVIKKSENEEFPFLTVKEKTTFRIEFNSNIEMGSCKATLFPDGSAIFYCPKYNIEDKDYSWRLRKFSIKESYGKGNVAFIELSNRQTGYMIKHDQKVFALEGGWENMEDEVVLGKAYR